MQHAPARGIDHARNRNTDAFTSADLLVIGEHLLNATRELLDQNVNIAIGLKTADHAELATHQIGDEDVCARRANIDADYLWARLTDNARPAIWFQLLPIDEMGAAEDLYIKSINTTVDQYRAFLQQVRADTLLLPNFDLDSGQATKANEYSLTDDAYAKLPAQVADGKFEHTSAELRDNILAFYSDLTLPMETKKNPARWHNLLTELDQLKSMTPVTRVAQ